MEINYCDWNAFLPVSENFEGEENFFQSVNFLTFFNFININVPPVMFCLI